MIEKNVVSIDDILVKKSYNEEEIKEHIKDIKLFKPRSPVMFFRDEIKDTLPKDKTNNQLFKLALKQYETLSQKEKEKYEQKENEDYEYLIKSLDTIEKYLIVDYYLYVETGEELYYQWCIKQAKIKGKDLTDARLLAQLNYQSMGKEEKKQWNKLNESNLKRLREIEKRFNRLKIRSAGFWKHFLKKKIEEEENRHVVLNKINIEINKLKRQKEKYNKYLEEYKQYMHDKYEKTMYLKLALEAETIVVYSRANYYHEKCEPGHHWFKTNNLHKQLEEMFKKEENVVEYEYILLKSTLINQYALYSNRYRNDILLHTIMTPKMLFYLKHLLYQDVNTINDNTKKVKYLREHWEKLPQSEKDKYIKDHQKIKKLVLEQRNLKQHEKRFWKETAKIEQDRADKLKELESEDENDSEPQEEKKKKPQPCRIKQTL